MIKDGIIKQKKSTIDGYPLWSETKVKVKVNETKSKSRFFRTFTFGFVYDYTFLFDLNYLRPREYGDAFLNEAKSKSMLNATNTSY